MIQNNDDSNYFKITDDSDGWFNPVTRDTIFIY